MILRGIRLNSGTHFFLPVAETLANPPLAPATSFNFLSAAACEEMVKSACTQRVDIDCWIYDTAAAAAEA